jgi:hypothetical protein
MAVEAGKYFELIFFLIAMVVTLYYVMQAASGKLKDPIRTMPQFVAISDGVDKAVEEGKYIYVTPGNLAYLSGLYAPMTINGMNVLRYTARLAIRRGAKIRFPSPFNAEAVPLIDGIYREVCVTEGKPEAYNRDEVRYYGGSEASFSAGAAADAGITGSSLIMCIGACSSAEMFLMGAGIVDGAMVIGGTPRYGHQSTYTAMADYPLYCEDIYGVGALASGSDEVGASLVGGDLVKLILVALTIVFAIIGFAGLDTIGWMTT